MLNTFFFGNRGIIQKNTLRAGDTKDDNMMLRTNDTICVLDKQAQIKKTLTILVLIAFPRRLSLLRRRANCFILRSSPYRAVNIFHLCYKNRSVYVVRATSRCLF